MQSITPSLRTCRSTHCKCRCNPITLPLSEPRSALLQCTASANFDGQTHCAPLQQGDSVQIRRAEQAVCFLHPTHWNYFDTLREKLHWNKGSA